MDRQWSDFLQDLLRYFLYSIYIAKYVLPISSPNCRAKFSSCYVLKLIASVVAALPEDLGQVAYDLKEIYDLIWSHPEFSTVMTAENEDDKTKGVSYNYCLFRHFE